MKDLILVVDMQNVYREGEAWGCRKTDRVIQNIRLLLTAEKADAVIFTRFDAPKEPVGTWRDYNEAYAEINGNEYLNDIMAELQEFTARYPVYAKNTYSSYEIEAVKKAVQNADRVVLTGVVAECCILATLLRLIDAGVKVLYVRDAIAGQSAAWEESVAKIAASFSVIHTEVTSVAEYLAN